MRRARLTRARGFTLIEVLVALVIVAFGMSAVLAALSASAENISALRDKTLAEWIALNQIADVRLIANSPTPGVSEGDVRAFGNADWHWRRDVIAVDLIPGMFEIAVRVRRLAPGETSTGNSSSTSIAPPKRLAGSSSGGGSFFSSSGGSSGGLGQSGVDRAMRQLGATNLPNTGDNKQWITTVIGFRGDSIGPPSGEEPDFGACVAGGAAGGCPSGSSSGGNSSSGAATIGPGRGPVTGPSNPGSGNTPAPTPFPTTGVN